MPKGGGAIRGIGDTFQNNFFSGSGNYSIPFPITAARGFDPQISLSYNSGSGNGPFGLGFSIGLAKISIRTDKGIPRYDGTELYILPDGTEILKKASTETTRNPRNEGAATVTTYLPRVQTEFSKIELWDDPVRGLSWKIVTSNNITHLLGCDDTSRIANAENKSQIFEWLIDECRHTTNRL